TRQANNGDAIKHRTTLWTTRLLIYMTEPCCCRSICTRVRRLQHLADNLELASTNSTRSNDYIWLPVLNRVRQGSFQSSGIIIGGYVSNHLYPRDISHRAQHRRIRVGDSGCPLGVRYLGCLNFCTPSTNEHARRAKYFYFEDGLGSHGCYCGSTNGRTCGNDCASCSDITPLDTNKLAGLSSWKRNGVTGLEELRRSSLFHRDDRSCISGYCRASHNRGSFAS